MKKLACLILISITCFAFSQDYSEKTSASEVQLEYTVWFNQLNHHLLESDSNYHVAMGVAAMLNGALSLTKDNSTEANVLLPQLSNVLNELIAQPDLDNETLDLLMVWCFKPVIQNNCDQQTLLEKQLQQQQDNLNAYFKSLQIAVEQDNPGLGHKIMRLMSEAKFSHMTLNTTAAFNKTIDQYIDNNPLPESYLNALSGDKKLMEQNNIKTDNAEQLMQDFAKTAIKTAYGMFYEPPDLKPLYFLCKTNNEFLDQCLAITQLLIHKSNTLNAKGLGYAILMGIHEGQNNKVLFDDVKKKQENYKQYLECLNMASQSPNPINEIFDAEYQKIQLKNLSELDKTKQLAQYIYNKYKDSNAEQINPEGCELKIKNKESS